MILFIFLKFKLLTLLNGMISIRVQELKTRTFRFPHHHHPPPLLPPHFLPLSCPPTVQVPVDGAAAGRLVYFKNTKNDIKERENHLLISPSL